MDHEATGDPTTPVYLQQLASLEADYADVIELLEGAGAQEETTPEGTSVTQPQRPVALGFLVRDISGDQEQRDRDAISELAARWGYHLAMVIIGPGVETPTLLLVEHIRVTDAVAVIAPEADHIWESRRAVTELCDLVVAQPERIWQHGHRWAPISHDPQPVHRDLASDWRG